MQDRKGFLGSQHLGRDLSGERPAMWGTGAGGSVGETAGVHVLEKNQLDISEEQRGVKGG